MKHKYRALWGLTADERTYIYSLCRFYRYEPSYIVSRIHQLCDEVAGEYSAALFEYLTTDANVEYIACKHYVSSSVLSSKTKLFFRQYRSRFFKVPIVSHSKQ